MFARLPSCGGPIPFRISGVARGGGAWPAQLLVNDFSPISARCYVLLVCK